MKKGKTILVSSMVLFATIAGLFAWKYNENMVEYADANVEVIELSDEDFHRTDSEKAQKKQEYDEGSIKKNLEEAFGGEFSVTLTGYNWDYDRYDSIDVTYIDDTGKVLSEDTIKKIEDWINTQYQVNSIKLTS